MRQLSVEKVTIAHWHQGNYDTRVTIKRRRDAIPNENQSKPFYENKTAHERRDWFRQTAPWDRVKPGVIDAIIEAFSEGETDFEAFVLISMGEKFVERYARLDDAAGTVVIRSQLSQILADYGRDSAAIIGSFVRDPSTVGESTFAHHYQLANIALDCAIILNRDQLAAYVSLTGLYLLLDKPEKAREYAAPGLRVLEEWRAKDVLSAVSKSRLFPDLQTMTTELSEIERMLRFALGAQ